MAAFHLCCFDSLNDSLAQIMIETLRMLRDGDGITGSEKQAGNRELK